MTKKLQDLPRVFAKAGIASKNDTFLLTLIGFHSTAGVVCSRVPVVPGCEESTRALAKAATELLASTDAGGTNYKSWVDALSDHVRPSDHVALALLTDGQLWDLPAFKVAYASLKASVAEFEACAIGCGAWANHDTVKEVATKGGGEALIESVDSSVSSMATRLLGKCFASMAIKHAIVVEDHVLAHKGAVGRRAHLSRELPPPAARRRGDLLPRPRRQASLRGRRLVLRQPRARAHPRASGRRWQALQV